MDDYPAAKLYRRDRLVDVVVARKGITWTYAPPKEMVADGLTKALGLEPFLHFREIGRQGALGAEDLA